MNRQGEQADSRQAGAQPPAAAADRSPSTPASMRGKAWFWAPIVPLVALDLWSKEAVFAWLAAAHPGMVLPEETVWNGAVTFSLVRWTNTGTIWGLFQGWTGALVAFRCVAIVALVWFAARTPRVQRGMLLVLGLILAGALGNLYDNFTQPDGGVRDFLRFRGAWPVAWDFPAFNVADSCITVGAFGLLIGLFRQDRASAGAASKLS